MALRSSYQPYSSNEELYRQHQRLLHERIKGIPETPVRREQIERQFEELLRAIHFFERPDIIPSPFPIHVADDSLHLKNKALEEEVAMLRKNQQQWAELSTEYRELQDTVRGLAALQNMYEDLQRKNQELELENTRLKHENKKHAETDKYAFDQLSQENEFLKQKLQQLQQEHAGDLKRLQKQCQKLQWEKDQAEQKHKQLLGELKDTAALRQKLVRIEEELVALKKQNETLQTTDAMTPQRKTQRSRSFKRVPSARILELSKPSKGYCETCVNVHKHGWACHH